MSKNHLIKTNSLIQKCNKCFDIILKKEDQKQDLNLSLAAPDNSLDDNYFNFLSDNNKEEEEKNEDLANSMNKENNINEQKNGEIEEGDENKEKNDENNCEKMKKGRSKKQKKNEGNKKSYSLCLCILCGNKYKEDYINIHKKNKHPPNPSNTNLEKALNYAEKCCALIDRSYNYIYIINLYAKTVYQLLSDADEGYKKMDWFINFEKCLNKMGEFNLNSNNIFQSEIKESVQLRENEQKK